MEILYWQVFNFSTKFWQNIVQNLKLEIVISYLLTELTILLTPVNSS